MDDHGAVTTPEHLPRYRVLTGPDDASFCHRVSEALDLGYSLHGGPALTVKDGRGYVAQAVIWESAAPTPRAGGAG